MGVDTCGGMTRDGRFCNEFRGLKADRYGLRYCWRHLRKAMPL